MKKFICFFVILFALATGHVFADVPLTHCQCYEGEPVTEPFRPTIEGANEPPAEIDPGDEPNFHGWVMEMCDFFPDTPFSTPVDGWYCSDPSKKTIINLDYMSVTAKVQVWNEIIAVKFEEKFCCDIWMPLGDTWAMRLGDGNAFHGVWADEDFWYEGWIVFRGPELIEIWLEASPKAYKVGWFKRVLLQKNEDPPESDKTPVDGQTRHRSPVGRAGIAR